MENVVFLQKYSILCMGKIIYYFYCFVIKYMMDMIFILQPICVVLKSPFFYLFFKRAILLLDIRRYRLIFALSEIFSSGRTEWFLVFLSLIW